MSSLCWHWVSSSGILRSEDDPNGIIYPQEALRVAQELRADKCAECSP